MLLSLAKNQSNLERIIVQQLDIINQFTASDRDNKSSILFVLREKSATVMEITTTQRLLIICL